MFRWCVCVCAAASIPSPLLPSLPDLLLLVFHTVGKGAWPLWSTPVDLTRTESSTDSDRFTGCWEPDVLLRGALVKTWFYSENKLIMNSCVCVCIYTVCTLKAHTRWIDSAVMLCDCRCVACLWEGMNSSCTVRLKDFRGRGRCEGQVRQERQINLHLTAANQLLPVYCHPGFSSYGDSTSLTFATSGTGAHPGSSAIIVPVPHHMTLGSSSDTLDPPPPPL